MSTHATAAELSYDDVLDDLSVASVHRSFDPYVDIDWDAPAMAIVDNDRRWVLPAGDPVGGHEWYRRQPLDVQIAIGKWRMANIAKTGLQFESILIRGLMQYSFRLRNGDREFRYCTHEAKEECNHTLMFQEYINRLGVQVPGARRGFRRISPFIPLAATAFPTIFFMGVLAGEEPIDHVQKDLLRGDTELHPATAAIFELHVAEEARHISFAHEYIRAAIPEKGRVSRWVLSLMLPIIMRTLCGVIMVPPRRFRRIFDIPDDVFREMFWDAPQSRSMLAGVFGDVRMLADQSGLMNPVSRWTWRRLGIAGRSSRYRSEPQYHPSAA
ncbi:diiron oxygenase [Gordonia sp. CPCC 206044]|uniref:AurF N-oxygenase family protein n=1 Tax=Gordonia sp. CPCC 206044 TaxID=3140793 RepID=UPI003AF3C3AE